MNIGPPTRYPQVSVELSSRNPYVWVSAVRSSLRHEGVGKSEILAFTEQALETSDPQRVHTVCSDWVNVSFPFP